DQRDWDFATKFGLPIVEVVKGGDITKEAFTLKDDTGIMVNSGFLNGMTVKEAIPAMKQYAVEQGWGHEKVNYKLRDWVFSRQRYWGEPIPMVSCPKCGWVPVPEDQLPLVLPQVESYEPTDDGESPISKMTDWVNTTCPCCGGPAKRETDTMPQWAGSSWYFLRYMDRTTTRHPSRMRRRNTGVRSTGTTAAWSTPRCTCSIPASGTSSSTTSASSTRRSPMPSARATV
ncbi:Leucyl-tRNA synthetase, partial [human gut metagenome]